MQTRSQGNHNLVPLNPDIDQLQHNIRAQRNRELAALREQAAMAHQQNMDNAAPQGEHAQGGPANWADNAFRPPPVFPPPAPAHPPRGRQIGAGDTPRDHRTRYGIVPPPFENNNFEIKSSTINFVENHPFTGQKGENPIVHLQRFDKYCGLFKTNGVSEDAFKLRLFPFSLSGRAASWEKQILSSTITTWEECKDAFLAKFYPSNKTAQMRNEISNFHQKHNEDFADALERFKIAISECPHHGFSEETLLGSLYRGVLPKVKTFLDGASNGNFLSRDVASGWELIDNMSASFGIDGEEYDRRQRGSFIESSDSSSREIKILSDKLDKLLSTQSKKPVHMVTNDVDASFDEDDL